MIYKSQKNKKWRQSKTGNRKKFETDVLQ